MVGTPIHRRFAKYRQNPVAAILLLWQAREIYLVLTSKFWTSVLPASDLFLHLADTIFQCPHGKVSLFLIDQEWR